MEDRVTTLYIHDVVQGKTRVWWEQPCGKDAWFEYMVDGYVCNFPDWVLEGISILDLAIEDISVPGVGVRWSEPHTDYYAGVKYLMRVPETVDVYKFFCSPSLIVDIEDLE